MQKNDIFNKILSVVLGALTGAFMWRCRGESGFGSSWGLYSVALVLLLLIWHFYGKRRGMRYEMLPVGALLAGLGVTGYATVIEQLSGTVWSDLPFNGPEPVDAPIDPKSGMVIILIMGFTLIPLFAFFVGSLFSEREYRLKHYIIAVAVFFGVSYIMKASLAHFILSAINPEQVNYAAEGLKYAGFDYSSPMKAYMTHFGNRSWTQDIPFFENYYMSVEHIADAFGVIGLAVYAAAFLKDKLTCIVSLVIDGFTAVATTALSLLLVACRDTGFLADTVCPRALEGGAGWGLWEFSTGGAIGLITMLVLALLPEKYTAQSEPDTSPFIENKLINFFFSFAATVFVFGVVPARVLGIRLNKLLVNLELMEDKDTLGTVMIIALSVIFGVIMLIKMKKNMLDHGGPAMSRDPYELALTAFPAHTLMCFIAYFFLNHGYLLILPYGEMTDLTTAMLLLTGPEHIATTVMMITFILGAVLYLILRRRLKRT